MEDYQSLTQELQKLAEERASQYPLKFYPNRKQFDQKLDEFAGLALKESEKMQIDQRVLPLCEKFRHSPVFLCGYYKTGTSMLTALLDWHPQALVLLPGSKVLFGVREHAEKLSRTGFFHYLAKEYVKALYNPAGHFPMNLLSPSVILSEAKNPFQRYSEFVAYLRHFIETSKNKAELLSALPCALFATNGQLERGHQPRCWIEKSVTNERHFELAKEIFPKAKFLYISRNPYDNLASMKRWYTNSGRANLANVYMYIRGLRRSLKQGLSLAKRDGFHFVRYEDIISEPQKRMQEIACFLGIDYTDSMTTPTIIGTPDRPNTSDTKEENKDKAGVILKSRVSKYKKTLSAKEIKDITTALGGLMKKLNYQTEPLSIVYKSVNILPLQIKTLLFKALLKLRSRG